MNPAERERQAADVMWDALAELGLRDSLGSAEYRREFASDRRIYEFSQAAFAIVGRLMMLSDGRTVVSSETDRP